MSARAWSGADAPAALATRLEDSPGNVCETTRVPLSFYLRTINSL
jgi:hypothetical protein